MAEPIRVLHVLGSLNAGGAESRTMDIYRNIDRSKIQFDFVIHTDEHCFFTDEVLSLGARIFTLPRFKGINYLEYKKAWEELFKKNKNLKIVHGHMTTTAFIYLKIAKQFGIKKRIAHARNSNKENVVKKILSKFAHVYATNLLAVSKEAAISEFGKHKSHSKVLIVPNLINYSRYYYSNIQRGTIRRELNIKKDQTVFIHIGRFHKQKNHGYILKVFRKYLDIYGNAILLLIGSGDLFDSTKKTAKKLGLDDYIYFLGIKNNVADYLSASDCMIFPSNYEGLPGVLLEAQINCLPVIASSNITQEVKINEKFIQLELKNNIDGWIRKMHKHSKREIVIDITKTSKKFDISNISKVIEKIYREK